MNTLNTYYCCDDLKKYLQLLSIPQNLVFNTNKPIQNNQDELILICEYHNNLFEVYSKLRLESIQNPLVILSFRKKYSISTNKYNSLILSFPASGFLRLPFDFSTFDQIINSLDMIDEPELIDIKVEILEVRIMYLISRLKHNNSNDIINKFFFPLRIMAYNLFHGLITTEKYELFILSQKENPSLKALSEINKNLAEWKDYHINSLNKLLFLNITENISLLLHEIDFLITNPMNKDNIKIIDKLTFNFQNLLKSLGK